MLLKSLSYSAEDEAKLWEFSLDADTVWGVGFRVWEYIHIMVSGST